MSKKFRYDHSSTIIDYMETYFKKKPKDCILYSEDGTCFEIHKELLGQTEFMRKLMKSARDYGSTSQGLLYLDGRNSQKYLHQDQAYF